MKKKMKGSLRWERFIEKEGLKPEIKERGDVKDNVQHVQDCAMLGGGHRLKFLLVICNRGTSP